jgi:glutamate/tyrosine decarboxylase-like PLP-dependent enzyme
MKDLLNDAAQRAIRYLEGINDRSVAPSKQALKAMEALNTPLPENPTDAQKVLEQLDTFGSPATVASAGGRYFGFVTGGALPASVAANWLAAAWDQNSVLWVASPITSYLEGIAGDWLIDIFGLPEDTACGFVTGATMANFTALAAARHAVLEKQGWDVEEQGLFGAPKINVVVGDEVHASVLKALSMLGLGRARLTRVPADGQGRMRPEALPQLDETTIICIQAGNVNTGAFDPAEEIYAAAKEAGAWVHVDGAFGLWAAAARGKAHLMAGYEKADSWATDAHKWLNVPYDSGLIFCRDEEHLRAAMSANASYLIKTEQRQTSDYTPELSRRARGVEVWAALLSLGRGGLADLIERTCRYAEQFASGLQDAGFEVLNEVALNQVLVKFGDAETTQKVIAAVQEEGTMWAGGSVWQGHTAMRISVSSWATTEQDIAQSLAALIKTANTVTKS